MKDLLKTTFETILENIEKEHGVTLSFQEEEKPHYFGDNVKVVDTRWRQHKIVKEYKDYVFISITSSRDFSFTNKSKESLQMTGYINRALGREIFDHKTIEEVFSPSSDKISTPYSSWKSEDYSGNEVIEKGKKLHLLVHELDMLTVTGIETFSDFILGTLLLDNKYAVAS
jgi:hypothetical protein